MGPLRALAAVVGLLWHESVRALLLLDIACHRLVQKVSPPQHVLLGRCLRRGMCCRHIVGHPPAALRRRPWAMGLYLRYHALVHRFEAIARTDEGAVVFRCGHLTPAGKCGIYRYRPRVCRTYPLLPYFGAPRLLPGCGYRTTRREVAAMQPRRGLPVLNAHVSVHHPDPDHRGGAGAVEQADDFHLVDLTQAPAVTPRGRP